MHDVSAVPISFSIRAVLSTSIETLGLIIPVIVQICLTTLVSVMIAVAYFRLRFPKEGAGLDHIAAVFE